MSAHEAWSAPIPIPSDARAHSFIDEALVVVMRRPHSFTGEDVVEVQCHGGPVILDQLCRALMSAGARLAAPGEFTKRAFLNGRLDLAQAEAVLDTIRAKTARSLAIAQSQRRGELSQEVEATRSVHWSWLSRTSRQRWILRRRTSRLCSRTN